MTEDKNSHLMSGPAWSSRGDLWVQPPPEKMRRWWKGRNGTRMECIACQQVETQNINTCVTAGFMVVIWIKQLVLMNKHRADPASRQTDRQGVMMEKQWVVGWPSVRGSQHDQFSLWIPEETHQRAWDWCAIKIHKVEAAREQADVSLKSWTPALGWNTNWETESRRED